MKIKITESQYKRLVEDVESPMDSLDKYKPVCFKYWDRFGPGITNKMVNVLAINKYVNRFEFRKVLYQWLREYIGVEDAINKTYEYLKNDGHHVNCGGYDFTFEVPDIEFIGEIGDLTIMVNDEDGTVELIMVDNSEHRLVDIINDDEIGWEIEYEIRDCVSDYIKINVEDKFGVVCHPNILFQSRNK